MAPTRARSRPATTPLAVLLLLLLPAAAAQVDPQARDPDLVLAAPVTALDLDGGTLAVGTTDPGSLFTGGEPVGGAPEVEVWHLFGPDGEKLSAGRADWVSGTQDCEDRPLDDCSGDVVGIGVAGNRMVVVSAVPRSPTDSHRGLLQVFDRDAGLMMLRYFDAVPVDAALSADGTHLAVLLRVEQVTGDATRVDGLVDDGDGLLPTTTYALDGAPQDITIAPDGQEAVARTSEGATRLAVSVAATKHMGAATATALAADGSHHAVTGNAAGDVKLFRQEQEAPLFTRRPGSAITAVAITTDGKAFAAGDDQGRVHLYGRVPDGSGNTTPVHQGSLDLGDSAVTTLGWSGDGILLIAGTGSDVHLLQRGTSEPGLSLLWSDPVPAAVTHVAATKQGDQVLAAWDDTVRAYDATIGVVGIGTRIALQPGEAGNATVTYQNTGNRPVEIDLSLRVPAGWNATLSEPRLEVPVGGTAAVTVQVAGPPGGAPERATVWVDHELEGRVAGTAVQVDIAEVHDVRLEAVGAPSASVRAGGAQRFHFVVENHGNVPEPILLEASTTTGWDARLFETSFTVAPGHTRAGTVDLEAPAEAVEGDHGEVEVRLADQTVSFTAAVGARFGLDMTFPPEVPIVPGNLTKFNVAIANTGNIVDGARLSIDPAAVPAGWIVQLENGQLVQEVRSIGPGEQVLVGVAVQVPDDLPPNGFLRLPFESTSLADENRTDRGITVLRVFDEDAPDTDTSAGPLALVAIGVLWATVRQRTRP